jgi:hypothetical protein
VQIVKGTPVSSVDHAMQGTTVTATASCAALPGSIVVGGGGQVVLTAGSSNPIGVIASSYPSNNTTWTVVGAVGDTNLQPGQVMIVTAYAICAV